MKRLCYRRISGKEKLVFGLELADLILIQLALMALLALTGRLLVTLPAVTALYFLIRLFKKNKFNFYTERLARFLARPRRFNLPGADGKELHNS